MNFRLLICKVTLNVPGPTKGLCKNISRRMAQKELAPVVAAGKDKWVAMGQG